MFWKKDSDGMEKSCDITRLLIPSILGIVLCVACLLGSTFAWFSASSSSATNTIKTANYTVLISIKDASDNELSADDSGTYTLSPGDYSITLTAQGTATKGYCVFLFGTNAEYEEKHTGSIYLGTPQTLKLTIAGDTAKTLRITPRWGKSDVSESLLISFDEPYSYP